MLHRTFCLYSFLISFQQTDTLGLLLECPVCLDILHSPVSSCESGHTICVKCRGKGCGECPFCQKAFNANTHSLINQILTTIKFRSKYAKLGCTFSTASKELTLHEGSCDYQTIKCHLFKYGQFCNDNIPRLEYPSHIEEHHDYCIDNTFQLFAEHKIILPRKNDLDLDKYFFRVLKDCKKKLYFLISTSYDEQKELYLISVHYIGKPSSASDYFYTIEVVQDSLGTYKHSKFCLPMMHPDEAKRFHPFLIFDHEKIYSVYNGLTYKLEIINKKMELGECSS